MLAFSWPLNSDTSITTHVASACLLTLVSASAQTKYTQASTAAGSSPDPHGQCNGQRRPGRKQGQSGGQPAASQRARPNSVCEIDEFRLGDDDVGLDLVDILDIDSVEETAHLRQPVCGPRHQLTLQIRSLFVGCFHNAAPRCSQTPGSVPDLHSEAHVRHRQPSCRRHCSHQFRILGRCGVMHEQGQRHAVLVDVGGNPPFGVGWQFHLGAEVVNVATTVRIPESDDH